MLKLVLIVPAVRRDSTPCLWVKNGPTAAPQTWEYDTNRNETLCRKSAQQTKSLKAVYTNAWGVSETNVMCIASAICDVITEHSNLKPVGTCKESVRSF